MTPTFSSSDAPLDACSVGACNSEFKLIKSDFRLFMPLFARYMGYVAEIILFMANL